MKTKNLLIAGVLTGLVLGAAGILQAQSLAELARKERAKRAKQPKATKVYTNDDMPHVTTMEPAATATSEAGTMEAGAKPAETGGTSSGSGTGEAKEPEDKKMTKEYWQGEFQKAQAALEHAQEESSLADDELSLAQMNEVRELDPQKKAVDARDVAAKQAAANSKHQALDKAKQAMEDLKKRFEESGAPADWLPAEEKKQ